MAWRVTILVSGANAVLEMDIDDGTTENTGNFNSGTALGTGSWFVFTVGVGRDVRAEQLIDESVPVRAVELIDEANGLARQTEAVGGKG